MALVGVVDRQQPRSQCLSSRCRQKALEQWNDIGESKWKGLRARIGTIVTPTLIQETTDLTRIVDAHRIQLPILWSSGADDLEMTPQDLTLMTSKSYQIGSTPVADHYMAGQPAKMAGPHEEVHSVGSLNAQEDGT